MDAFDRLTDSFKRFPGIGARQARRFVFFLLQSDPAYFDELTRLMAEVRQSVVQCASCYRYFQKGSRGSNGSMCALCADTTADRTELLVVEKDVDLESMAKSGVYHGRYFVLGGTLEVLEKDPSSIIRSRELFSRIQERAQTEGLKEVVLALSATPEGDTTAQYLEKVLAPLAEKFGIIVTALGRGLSTGSELEYADPETLKNAWESRRK